MFELFDYHYAALIEAVAPATIMVVSAMGIRRERSFHYRDFNNTWSSKSDGVKDPIVVMKWLYDVEGLFFTCSCMDDHNVKCTLNLL